jgi:seryl-tRNA synthetase
MLDIKFIRENPSLVQKKAKEKNISVNIDHLLHLDTSYRELSTQVQNLQSERNIYAKERNIEKGKEIKNILDKKEHDLTALKQELEQLLLQVPNPAADDVPIGKDESGNVEVKKVGDIPKFDFEPKSHEEIALRLDLYDTKRAVQIAGTRAYFLKNDLVFLEQALLRFGLDFMSSQEFIPMTVPWMVNKEAMWGTGYFPWGIEDHYTTQDGQALIGTSEVSLTAYHQDEILEEKDLPIKMVGISPCFRREVGSYGKDTKGFIRVHQFNKIEQVVLTVADEQESRKWHETMLGFSESILQQLELPYRVLLMCTGDMGAGQRKKYDIETWFPSQGKYRETHSASYFNDFQSRRLNMKYKTKTGEKKYVYTLNNTVIATPRLLAAIIENYQQKDGSILIPKVLQKYMSKEKISSQK